MKLDEQVLFQLEEGEDASKSSLDVFLDDDKKEVKEEKKEEEKKEDDKGEDKEIESKEEDEGKEEGKKDKKDENEEDEIALARLDYNEIKKEFPELFNKFPTLKHAFFREQQFTELYPTVEDAKAAAEKSAAYDEISEAVVSGDAGKFIDDLKTESEEGLSSFAKAFFPALLEKNRDLYLDVVSPTVAQFVKNVYAHGTKENDANIQNAAKIVHKILFGGEYDDIKKEVEGIAKPREKTADEKKFEAEKNKHFSDKYNTLYNDVSRTCYSALEKDIDKGLEDLKDEPGLQKLIADKIRREILEEMDKDGAYLGRVNALWKQEQRNGFSGTKKESIKAAFLAKARALVPKIRAKIRADVVGNRKAENTEDKDKKINRPDAGRQGPGTGPKMSVARVKQEGLSTKDVFDKD